MQLGSYFYEGGCTMYMLVRTVFYDVVIHNESARFFFRHGSNLTFCGNLRGSGYFFNQAFFLEQRMAVGFFD